MRRLARPFLIAAVLVGCQSMDNPSSPRTNLPLPTLGGKQVWADLAWRGGWRLQENVLTGHARVLDPGEVRRAWGPLADCREHFETVAPPAPEPAEGRRLVILLHGLGRSRAVWSAMSARLEAEGYTVAALSYPSTRRSPREHAACLAGLLADLEGYQDVAFVTHSMGGIVVRELLAHHAEDWPTRLRPRCLIMLAPPNQGSALARQLSMLPPFHWVFGDAGRSMLPSELADLPGPSIPTMVIAGSRGEPQGWNPLLPGDDDGVVSVAETALSGVQERLVIRGIHTFLMKQPAAIEAACRFLGPAGPAPAGG